ESAGALLQRYETVFCDVWGVLHDGVHAHAAAEDALLRFKAVGGVVILVSNAPVPKHRVAAMLASKGFDATAYDDIVSSGDIALRHIKAAGFSKLHGIGPRDRDRALFEATRAEFVDIDDAQAILCTGLNDDLNEVAEDYDARLRQAHARNLTFICANPDKVVDVGGELYLCAGAIADRYAAMGGNVFWAGKPHASAYTTARTVAEELRGTSIALSKILAIGDAVRTDLKAAENVGVDALFITGGIHRDEVMRGDVINHQQLAELFAGSTDGNAAPTAIAAMPQLVW
ncbi:MAG: TIGR01459 family HAD-type hydrolase, partial [Pseudomonadota bacterium]